MKFTTLTSSFVLSLILIGPEAMAMEEKPGDTGEPGRAHVKPNPDSDFLLTQSMLSPGLATKMMVGLQPGATAAQRSEAEEAARQLQQKAEARRAATTQESVPPLVSLNQGEQEAVSWFRGWFITPQPPKEEQLPPTSYVQTPPAPKPTSSFWSTLNPFGWWGGTTEESPDPDPSAAPLIPLDTVLDPANIVALSQSQTTSSTMGKNNGDDEISSTPTNSALDSANIVHALSQSTIFSSTPMESTETGEPTHNVIAVKQVPLEVKKRNENVIIDIPCSLNNLGNSQAVTENRYGLKVISKDDNDQTYQLESDPLAIIPGQKLKASLSLEVENGQVFIGFLNSKRNWYLESISLRPGEHHETLEVSVPEDETKTWLEFYKPVETGQAIFTVKALNVEIIEKAESEFEEIPYSFRDLGNSDGVQRDLSTGSIKVISKNDNDYTYQLESEPFIIQEGDNIKASYDITVESGEVLLGFLRSSRHAFFETVNLGQGTHKGTLNITVFEGDTTTWLDICKHANRGQALFTVNSLKVMKKIK